MSIQRNLNVPAQLIHTVHGTTYKINGTILSINEAAGTCKMSFKNGRLIEDNISLKNIYLNEDALDLIKNVGSKIGRGIKKAVNYVISTVKRIGGFWTLTIENPETGEQEELPTDSAPINLAYIQELGQAPEGIKISGNASAVEAYKESGVNIPVDEHPLSNATYDEDLQDILTYWTRVMKEYTENESFSSKEAVQYVNENYYVDSNLVKSNRLNEDTGGHIASLAATNANNIIGIDALSRFVANNLKEQLTSYQPPRVGGGSINARGGSKAKACIILGAPGIGKTSVLSQAEKLLKGLINDKLLTITINAASINREDLTLPDIKNFQSKIYINNKNNVNTENYLTSTVEDNENYTGSTVVERFKEYLPLYYLPDTQEKINAIDNFYNTCRFRTGLENGKAGYTGGILFIDEFTRIAPDVMNIFNSLFIDRKYNGAYLASKWAIIGAGNRKIDMNAATREEFVWEASNSGRFSGIYNYIPTKFDWIKWARSKNNRTGKQNVPEQICLFIESVEDAVWYDAVDLGSRSKGTSPDWAVDYKKLRKQQNTSRTGIVSLNNKQKYANDDELDIAAANELEKQGIELGENYIIYNTWNPRTWEDIGNAYQFLVDSLEGKEVGYYVEKYLKVLSRGENIPVNEFSAELDKHQEINNDENLKDIILSVYKKLNDLNVTTDEFFEYFHNQEAIKSEEETRPALDKLCGYFKELTAPLSNKESIRTFQNWYSSIELAIDPKHDYISLLAKKPMDLRFTKEEYDFEEYVNKVDFENSNLDYSKLNKIIEPLVDLYLEHIIGERTGVDNLPRKEYENFLKYRNIFTKANCYSIWNTGQLGIPDMKELDNLFIGQKTKDGKEITNYITDEKLMWKGNISIFTNVIKTLWEFYPGDITEEITKYGSVDNIKTSYKIDNIKADKIIKPNININQNTVNLISVDFDNFDGQGNSIISYSPIVQQLYDKDTKDFTISALGSDNTIRNICIFPGLDINNLNGRNPYSENNLQDMTYYNFLYMAQINCPFIRRYFKYTAWVAKETLQTSNIQFFGNTNSYENKRNGGLAFNNLKIIPREILQLRENQIKNQNQYIDIYNYGTLGLKSNYYNYIKDYSISINGQEIKISDLGKLKKSDEDTYNQLFDKDNEYIITNNNGEKSKLSSDYIDCIGEVFGDPRESDETSITSYINDDIENHKYGILLPYNIAVTKLSIVISDYIDNYGTRYSKK